MYVNLHFFAHQGPLPLLVSPTDEQSLGNRFYELPSLDAMVPLRLLLQTVALAIGTDEKIAQKAHSPED